MNGECEDFIEFSVMVNNRAPPLLRSTNNTVLRTVIAIPLLEGKLEHVNKTQEIDNTVRLTVIPLLQGLVTAIREASNTVGGP